jgi:hypothetical protein
MIVVLTLVAIVVWSSTTMTCVNGWIVNIYGWSPGPTIRQQTTRLPTSTPTKKGQARGLALRPNGIAPSGVRGDVDGVPRGVDAWVRINDLVRPQSLALSSASTSTSNQDDVKLEQLFLGPSLPIDASQLGPLGVGDLTDVPGARNAATRAPCQGPAATCVLDNRHLSLPLQQALCGGGSDGGGSGPVAAAAEDARNYFDALIGLVWPFNTELWLCCTDEFLTSNATTTAAATAPPACNEPAHVFAARNTQEEAMGLAPHFLTGILFGPEQQQVLTAALIAKINTRGIKLRMELAGRFDLGAAGTRFWPREYRDDFPHAIGQAWGNMFLDCAGADADQAMCQASAEKDRDIGRDPANHHLAMFTCSSNGSDDNAFLYPLADMGKSCFSDTMERNEEGGCGYVAAVGPCDRVCLAGFCGANQPPVEGRGTTNVVYVYMADPVEPAVVEDRNGDKSDGNDDDPTSALKIALFVAMGLALLLVWALVVRLCGTWSTKRMAQAPSAAKHSIEDDDNTEATTDDVVQV